MMNFKATAIPYSKTHYFSKTVLDYISESGSLRPFYQSFPKKEEIAAAVLTKKAHYAHRALLHQALQTQYQTIEKHPAVSANIKHLAQAKTFTITTAHQPNIFTGPLYFIYKILHAIKLAIYCKEQLPQYHFVSVYYMGSEDADFDELGHIYLNQEKLNWSTTQTGAVGRMKIDESFHALIQRIESEIAVLPFGPEIMNTVKKYYRRGQNIQNATLGFVNDLFGKYGLIIVVPDNALLKSAAADVFEDELIHQTSSKIVAQTTAQMVAAEYEPQAHGRDINLFYLKEDGARLRIEQKEKLWQAVGSKIRFDEETLLNELNKHPERFSPNVILRGLFQEAVLPNIFFISGGGELAYWLQLKAVFQHYKVPYPMLVVRNSFLLVSQKQHIKMKKLGIKADTIFEPTLKLQSDWVKNNTDRNISVDHYLSELRTVYEKLSQQAALIDPTLKNHIYTLQKQSEKKVAEAGKKMLRAEKRNHADAMQQIQTLKNQLFPFGNLQERIHNFLPYYAQWGATFIDDALKHSHALQQEFVVLEED